MSEKLSRTPEHHKSPEHQHETEKSPEHNERPKEQLPEKSAEQSKGDIEKIKKSIESTALSGKEYGVGEKETPQDQQYGTTKEIKQTAYRKLIKKTQSQLKGPEKTFSKLIHRPTIEKSSEIASKTVARPTSFLMGSIFAFLASLIVFYISKRNGFEYNYLLFIIVFIGGYFFGLIVEMIAWIFKKPKRG